MNSGEFYSRRPRGRLTSEEKSNLATGLRKLFQPVDDNDLWSALAALEKVARRK